MRLVPREASEEASQVSSQIGGFVLEVATVEVKDCVRVLAELGEVIHILENEALVEPNYELIEEELGHVRRDVLSFEDGLLDVSAYLDVVMGRNTVVDHQQPHSHVFKGVDLGIFVRVGSREFALEVVVELGAVPNGFSQVTSERLQGVKDVKEGCPEHLELVFGIQFGAVFLLVQLQVRFENVKG